MEPVRDILQRIEEITVNEPNLPVFQDRDKTYTYQDLKAKSDCIASYILERLGTERLPIIVYGKQDFTMLATMIACSKAGRAYIPIDEHTPTERLQMIVDVAKPEIILYSEQKDDGILGIEQKSVKSLRGIEREDYPGLDLDDVYYIIFTSGTTGVPKGVEITHRNLLSFVNWSLTDFNYKERPRFLVQAPFSFDLSVMSLYPSLTMGGELLPLDKDIINDFQRLFEVLPKLNLNIWVSTPLFMEICLMQPTFDAEHMHGLTHFLFCGEELAHSTAAKLRERFPNAYIYNTYGPTEATVAITSIDITKEVLANNERLPIGYVKEDTEVVLMLDGKEVPKGERGEIVIVGPSVAKDYLNNPAKTAENFFEYNGITAYKTGDLGHFDDQDILYYDGRLDYQIKYHGYRMELEDIDHHLNQVKYVKQAAVVPKYKDNKVQQLIAYVVPNNEYEFEKDFKRTKAIKQKMSETVMDYMIPQKFVYVEELALTNNGKIDRKRLINEVNAT